MANNETGKTETVKASTRKPTANKSRGKGDTVQGIAVARASGKDGMVVSAGQLASIYNVDAKRFRKWLRSGETVLGANDKVYTRYAFDLESDFGVALAKQAIKQFKSETAS